MIKMPMPLLIILADRLNKLLSRKKYNYNFVVETALEVQSLRLVVIDELTKETTQINVNDFEDKLEEFDKIVNDFINRKQIIRQERIEQIIKTLIYIKNEK